MNNLRPQAAHYKERLMDRRAYERIPANVQIRFFYDDTMYTGTIMNLSKNSMYIKTDIRLYYYKLKFKVLIPLVHGVLEVPVKIGRLVQTEGFYDGMGVQLLDLPKQYLEYVDSLKSALQSASSERVM